MFLYRDSDPAWLAERQGVLRGLTVRQWEKAEQRLRHEGTGTADMSLGAVALGSAQRRGWRRASALRHARMGARSGLSKQSVAQRTTRGTALGRRECAASTVRLPAKAQCHRVWRL